MVSDAIEIGARVLDREQAGAGVEVLRQNLEKASREVEQRLGQTGEQVVAELKTQLEQAFGPDRATSPACSRATSAPSPRPPCSTRSAPPSPSC